MLIGLEFGASALNDGCVVYSLENTCGLLTLFAVPREEIIFDCVIS
jgi:hypothetical protein